MRRIRQAVGVRDQVVPSCGLIEIDDDFSGGNPIRGMHGKTQVLLAVEQCGKGSSFMTSKALERVDYQQIMQITQSLHPSATVCRAAYLSLNTVERNCEQQAKITPPKRAAQQFPKVHFAMANFKCFLLGSFHGVSRLNLHEYKIKFVYRFYRRRWQSQLLLRITLGLILNRLG